MPGDWLAGLGGIGRGCLAVSQKLLGAVRSRFHDQTGSGVLRSACGELGAGRAGSRSPDLPNLMHQEGRAHTEAGEGRDESLQGQVRCRETERWESCSADTSADPDGKKNVVNTVLLESGYSVEAVTGEFRWTIVDEMVYAPLWRTLGFPNTPCVDGEGSHGAGLGTLSGNHADLLHLHWEVWEVSPLGWTSHHPASFHPNSPLQICPSSTLVPGTREQTPSLLQEGGGKQPGTQPI